jgi:hypothetical protein
MSPPAKRRLNFSTLVDAEVKKSRGEKNPNEDLEEFHLDGEETGWFLIIF